METHVQCTHVHNKHLAKINDDFTYFYERSFHFSQENNLKWENFKARGMTLKASLLAEFTHVRLGCHRENPAQAQIHKEGCPLPVIHPIRDDCILITF